MNVLEEFKAKLKEYQAERKKEIKALEEEIKFTKKFNKGFDFAVCINERKCPKLYKHYSIYYREKGLTSYSENVKMSDKSMTLDYVFSEEDDCNSLYNYAIQKESKHYLEFQALISAIQDGKIINYINLENLLLALKQIKMPIIASSQIFGIAVSYNAKYIERREIDEDVRNMIGNLSKFFDSNGNFNLDSDEEELKTLLYSYCKPTKTNHIGTFVPSENVSIINIDCGLLIYVGGILTYFKECKEKGMPEVEIKQVEETASLPIPNFKEGKIISKERREKLRKYYHNGVLVTLPEDMDEFSHLLDECDVDEIEKRHIYGLINERLKDLKKNKISKYLSDDDQDVYEEALRLFNDMKPNDGNYWLLKQYISDLKNAIDMLEDSLDEADKEYILSEIEELIQNIKDLISKPEIQDEANNLMFLCNDSEVPFLAEDVDRLDGGLYKMLCNGIRKIRKDNQGNFRLILTNENLKYRVFSVLSSKVHVAFTELDEGIYLIVGASATPQGYPEMIRRVIASEDKIVELEASLKNNDSRDQELNSHIKYVNMFTPNDNPNVSR